MQQYLENEAASFSGIKETIEAHFSPDKDIPPGLMLGETNPGPVYPVPVAVYRPPGKIGIEKWFFRETGDIKAFIASLSDPAKEAVGSMAENVGIDEGQVFKAALLTRTLIDNTGDRLSVVLDEGPELLKLVPTSLGETNTNGLYVPGRQGFSLEYYIPVQAINYGGVAVSVMYRLANTFHSNKTFEEIFPPVLLFSAAVAQKHELHKAMQETQTDVHETEGGESTLVV